MSWYEKIKGYYERGLWTAKRVDDAAAKGVITQAQADEIKGEK